MSVEPNNLMTVAAATIVLLSGVLLVVGFLTPGASSILGVAGVVLMTRGDLEAALVTANAAAVVLLGPGAFSIDARLFGRREILITPDRRES